MAHSPLLHERQTIVITNYCGWDIKVHCQSGDTDMGWIWLKDKQPTKFSFYPHLFHRTHFWCTAESMGKQVAFPIYSKGAPRGSNHYELYGYGIYENGQKRYDWPA